MYPGGMCPQRAILLDKWNHAAKAHLRAVTDLGKIAGTGNAELFKELLERARDTLQATRAASKSYEDHLKEHGCSN